MKVLHIYDTMGFGGLEVLALDLCRNAGKYGMDLSVIFTRKGDNEEAYRSSGVRYYLLNRNKTFDIPLFKNIRKIIKKEKFDVIHTHQLIMSFYAYLASGRKGIKLVQSFHGNIKGLKNHLLKNYLVKRFDANISVSKGFLEQLKTYSKINIENNFFIAHNGIDKNKFTEKTGKLRKELNINDNEIIAGSVANFYSEERDQMTICRALKKLKDKKIKIKFVFIGDKNRKKPQLFKNCFNYCSENDLTDNVYFLGKRGDVNELLPDLDIFVFSSVGDSFGISVIEAMMCHVPVIVSDIPPMLEITCNGEYGVIFKRKNPENLAEKISDLFLNHSQRISLAEKGKNYAVNNFDISNYIFRLNDIYSKK